MKQAMRPVVLLSTSLAACATLNGCVMVGYSSRGGFFIWPGSIGLLVLLAILWLIFSRR